MNVISAGLRGLLAAACGAAAWLGGGCAAQVYSVNVDAMARPLPAGAQAYRLRSRDPRLGEESLRYREAAELVRTALSGKGLYEAASEDRADLIVDFEFGMEPVLPPRAPGSGPPGNPAPGAPPPETMPRGEARGPSAPRPAAANGSPPGPRPPVAFAKFLKVSAREARPAAEGRAPDEIWNIQVSTVDESNDLRRYLPVMAAATAGLLGRDTAGQKTLRLRADDPGVEFIRRGMPTEMPPSGAARAPR